MKPFLPILLGAALSFPPIQAQAQVQADGSGPGRQGRIAGARAGGA